MNLNGPVTWVGLVSMVTTSGDVSKIFPPLGGRLPIEGRGSCMFYPLVVRI